jgi:hypothetical protein
MSPFSSNHQRLQRQNRKRTPLSQALACLEKHYTTLLTVTIDKRNNLSSDYRYWAGSRVHFFSSFSSSKEPVNDIPTYTRWTLEKGANVEMFVPGHSETAIPSHSFDYWHWGDAQRHG